MPFAHERIAANRALLAQRSMTTALRQTRFTFDPDQVLQQLQSRIIGQEPELNRIAGLLHVVRADISPENRPLGVCLLMGPTGVGKTETVRVLAELLLGNGDALCRIDMNTLSQEHYASALTGAPPGYVGSKEGHTLFDAERIQGSYNKPGIVLFDELEKASTEVIRSLLNVLDSGILTLPAGNRRIDFRNSLIFLTSNLGAADVMHYQSRFERGWRRLLKPRQQTELEIMQTALSKRFDPEFINRIDHILYYRRLPATESEHLLDLELSKLRRRLGKQQATLSITGAARQHLCRDYDPRYGARDLARRVQHELTPALARALLEIPEGTEFVVECVGEQLRVRLRE